MGRSVRTHQTAYGRTRQEKFRLTELPGRAAGKGLCRCAGHDGCRSTPVAREKTGVRRGRGRIAVPRLMTALRQAQCMDIVEKMPDGVHTVIGTNGVYLSGGEGQRIAIARAILKNSPIIILDEATAFADPDNEVRVQAAFKELAKDRTVIMIAHRLSTVTSADCIYVLKDGSIAEVSYRRFYNTVEALGAALAEMGYG